MTYEQFAQSLPARIPGGLTLVRIGSPSLLDDKTSFVVELLATDGQRWLWPFLIENGEVLDPDQITRAHASAAFGGSP